MEGFTKIGKIRPVFRGEWSAAAEYTVLDTVRSKNGRAVYVALKDVPAGTLLTDAAYWGVALDADTAIETAVQEIENLKDGILYVEEKVVDKEFDEVHTGAYIHANGSIITESKAKYGLVHSVRAGDTYQIKSSPVSNVRAWLLIDGNGVPQQYSPTQSPQVNFDYEEIVLTIPSSCDGYTLCVNTFKTNWIGLRKVEKNRVLIMDMFADGTLPLSKLEMLPVTNPLRGKVAVFDGDSICKGAADEAGLAWAGRIAQRNGMTCINYARSGGTVCTDMYNWDEADTSALDWSAKTYYVRNNDATATPDMYTAITQNEWNGEGKLYTKGAARHWESTYIDTIYAERPDADYVILEACLNDGFNTAPLGSVPSSYYASVVTTNYAGAFEYMLRRALALFSAARIGVIISPYPRSSQPNAYHEIAREVCKKYSIPVMDLQREGGLCPWIEEQKQLMYGDSTHPNAAGYEMITPRIEAWMRSL